jgi:hypothetical protein
MEKDPIVTINVGGTKFVTKTSTLLKSTFFVSLLNNNWDWQDDLIDTSPQNFVHILNYMKNPEYPFDRKLSYELDFYGIKYNIDDLYDPDAILLELKKEIINVNNKINNVTDAITTMRYELKNEIVDVYNRLQPMYMIYNDKWNKIKADRNLCSEDGCDQIQCSNHYKCNDHCDCRDKYY